MGIFRMTTKLTREQAELLISKIAKFYSAHYGNRDMRMFMPDLASIINQCTEKEFPRFEMKDVRDGRIGCRQRDNLDIEIYLSNTVYGNNGYGGIVVLSNELLKEFAQGINKIVEYLNDHTAN